MSSIWKFLQAPVFDDEEKTRRAALLHVVLLANAAGGILISAIGVAVFLATKLTTELLNASIALLSLVLVIFLQFLMRRGHVTVAAAALIAFVGLSTMIGLFFQGTIRSAGVIFLPAVVIMAMLLIGRRTGVFVAALMAVLGLALIFGEQQNLLPEPGTQASLASIGYVLAGIFLVTFLLHLSLKQLDVAIEDSRRRETETRSLATSLEQRVSERTAVMEQTNLYLALATEVGQNVAQVRDLNVMLRDAAEIIRAFFGMYYVQVYLANPAQTELILQFGTGSVGAELLSRRHRLPLDETSINGRAAVTKRSVVIADTLESAIFRPNPLLPNTRSEMAVPLLIGDQLIGVLDMQSEQPNALSENALIAFEPLSGQLAIAVQNARLIAEAQQARKELEALTYRLTHTGWDEYLDAIHRPEKTGFVYEENQVVPLTAAKIEPASKAPAVAADVAIGGEVLGTLAVESDKPLQNTRSAELLQSVARQVAQQIENLRLLDSADRYRAEAEDALRRLTREGWQAAREASVEPGYLYRDYEVYPIPQIDAQGEGFQIFPLMVRNEPIGEVGIAEKEEFAEEDKDLLATVMQQLSTHLEGLRLARQTELALVETEELYAASARIGRATTMNDLLRALVESTDLARFESAVLSLFDRPWNETRPEWAKIVGLWEKNRPVDEAFLGTETSIGLVPITYLAQRERPVFVRDAPQDARLTDDELRAQMRNVGKHVAILPLVVAEQWIGWVTVSSNEDVDLAPDELRQLETLVGQAAAVVQNMRLYEQTQIALAQTETLYEIGRLLNNANNVDEILEAVSLPARQQDCREATLIYFDLDENNQPDTMTVMAVWSSDGREALPAGAHMQLANSPFAVLLNSGPGGLLLFHDILDTGQLPAEFRESMAGSGSRAMAVIPLVQAGRWLGVVLFRWADVHVFSQVESDIYGALTGLAAPAVQSRRLLIQAQSRAQREQALRQITSAVRASTDPATIMRTAVREIGTILGRKALIRMDRPDMLEQAAGDENGQAGMATTVQDLGAT